MSNKNGSRLQPNPLHPEGNGTIERGSSGASSSPVAGDDSDVVIQGGVPAVARAVDQHQDRRVHSAGSAFSAVQRRIKDGKKAWGLACDPLWTNLPTLAEWLMLRTLDGIRIREVATLNLSATPTGFAATLSDYYLGIKLPVKAPTLYGLFEELEKQLNNSEAAWIELEKGTGAERRKQKERDDLAKRGAKKDDVFLEEGGEKNL